MWNVYRIFFSILLPAISVIVSACNPLAQKSSVDANFTPGLNTTVAAKAISISSPSQNGFINASSDSATYAVTGTCNVSNGTVSIKLDGNQIATAVCTGVSFAASVNSTTFSAAVHALTATLSDSAADTATATANFTRDVTAPNNATLLVWSQASPGPAALTASWTLSNSADLGNQKIQFYADGTCTSASGSLIDLGSNSANSKTFTGSDTITYSYKITSVDNAGNSSVSGCSSLMLVDAVLPTVTLTSTTGGANYRGGATQAITWTASDNVALVANPIAIEVSSNGGSTWASVATGLANSGTYNWTVPSVDSATYRVRVKATDTAGNVGIAASSSNFTIDSTGPVITAASYVIAGGATSITNNNVTVAIQATDALSTISHVCIKTSLAAVTMSDACWVPMATVQPGYVAASSINVSTYNYNIGVAGGAYNIYIYIKDSVGNFSSLTNTGAGTVGTDKYSLTYTPGSPAVLTYLNATNSNASTYPPAAADLMINSGQDLVIKWNAADDNAIPAGSLSIYYTTNDSTYTLVASGLNNSTNNGAGGETCTIGGSYTGCFVWSHTLGTPPPVLSYFRVRVQITDSNGYITKSTALPNNVSGVFNFIAGNTDQGLGGSAKSAAIITALQGAEADQHSFVVASDGVVYYRDYNNNKLLKINPVDGTITQIGTVTGVFTGDGGPISAAGFYQIGKLAIDYNDRLLIVDGNRIRRYDPSTGIVNTLIGGGASTVEGVDALSLQMTSTPSLTINSNPLVPLPNGDLIFTNDLSGSTIQGGYKLRRYQASTGKIYSVNLTGIGTHLSNTDDITYCYPYGLGIGFDPSNSSFNAIQYGTSSNGVNCTSGGYAYMNPSPISMSPETYTTCGTGACHTGAINPNGYTADRVTGMNGVMYAYGHRFGYIYKFNSTTSVWSIIAGTGVVGQCNDNTVATSCAIDPYTVFVNAQGVVHFLDRNRIRIIDENGKVQTLYGQSLSYGDAGDALAARFNSIKTVSRRTDNGKFITMDVNEYKLREFAIAGNINSIAGNGSNNYTTVGVNATTVPFSIIDYNGDFDIDPTNGNVYYVHDTTKVNRLNRATGFWETFIGGGATSYSAADGLTGSNITTTDISPKVSYRDTRVLGFDQSTSKVLVTYTKYNGATPATPWVDSMLKLYTTATGTQSSFAGVTGFASGADTKSPNYCADGTALNACVLPNSTAETFYKHAVYEPVNNKWFMSDYNGAVKTFVLGGNIGTITTFPVQDVGFTMYYDGTNYNFLYCPSSTLVLRKRVVQTNGTLLSDTALSWPIAAMKCNSRSMVYESGGSPKLTFTYTLNGLQGVAQYLNP